MGWIKYISVFLISAIFGFSLISFIYQIEVANHAPITILDHPDLAGLNSSMSSMFTNFNQNVSLQANASSSEQVAPPTGAFVLFSVITSLGRFIALPFVFINSLFKALANVLGIPEVILGVITALILLIGIFLWYRMSKVGE
jgi:hypothetical protein